MNLHLEENTASERASGVMDRCTQETGGKTSFKELESMSGLTEDNSTVSGVIITWKAWACTLGRME